MEEECTVSGRMGGEGKGEENCKQMNVWNGNGWIEWYGMIGKGVGGSDICLLKVRNPQKFG